MADTTVNWTGESGKKYNFYIRKLPNRPPNKDERGNYIFCKVSNGYYSPIYIGEGKLQERYDAAIAEKCVNSKGATHYHVHLNSDQAARKTEESDLIAGNTQCEWPNGCNGHD